MKVPVEWLASQTDLAGVSEDELARALTMAGLEVEEIHGAPGERVLITKVTPNRGDWMSIAGVAREAAAALDRPLPETPLAGADSASDIDAIASVEVADHTLCPRYGLRIVRRIKHGPSPDFIARRITQAGMRPLGIVVDITNYVMIELGQPLHAFDYDKIPGGKIIVRPATPGETIQTLDGSDRALPADSLVIADQTHPIAVAGIMGGADSEVSDATTTIALESAHFDSGVVRRGAKALGLSTEASYRFERFVDPALVPIALDRAVHLLEKYAGGTAVPGMIDTNPDAAAAAAVDVRPERVNAILGESLTVEQIVHALNRLGLNSTFGAGADNRGLLSVTVPSFRPDLTREIDLIEEVGRMIGYETLPETLPPARGDGGGDLPAGRFDSRMRALLIGEGLSEAFSHTLTSESAFDDPAIEPHRVRIRMALSAELTGLRQSLIPNLLEILALNTRHRTPAVRLFEIGKVFGTDGPGQYREVRRAAAALTGGDQTYATAKGIVENILSALHLNAIYRPAIRHAMHPGRCAEVEIGGVSAGYIAEADPDLVREKLDVPASIGRVAVFELDLDLLREASAAAVIKYHPQPRFPSLSRDLAMVFARHTPYGAVEESARAAGGSLLESVALLSVYTGERMAEDKKSVAIRLVLRAPDRTLTDADADHMLTAVQSALVDIGGESR